MRERGGTQKQFRTGVREHRRRQKNRGTLARGTQAHRNARTSLGILVPTVHPLYNQQKPVFSDLASLIMSFYPFPTS